ncbi:MAG: diaminopimelate decarboxylase family protein, partial [Hyphomicrobiaceae bacterium]
MRVGKAMHHFTYRNGILHAEDVNLERLAEDVGTPFYCYATATVERHYRLFAEAVGVPHHRVFFAMKANGNLAVLQTLGQLGAGADTVSEGEIRKAMAAGIPAGRIVFSGVGKTEGELAHAVDVDLYQVNIETESELDALSRIAAGKGKRQTAALRVNPAVGSGGHAKITTGAAGNKFGVGIEDVVRLYAKARNLPSVRMLGLAVHIGSQIEELDDLEVAFKRLRALTLELRAAGHTVERIDLGGGLAIPYQVPEPFTHGPELILAYAAMVERIFGSLDVERSFEPGRIVVGNAGILVTRVEFVKRTGHKNFLIVDAAMN